MSVKTVFADDSGATRPLISALLEALQRHLVPICLGRHPMVMDFIPTV